MVFFLGVNKSAALAFMIQSSLCEKNDRLCERLKSNSSSDRPPDSFTILYPLPDAVFSETAFVELHTNRLANWFVDGQLIGWGEVVAWRAEPGLHQIMAAYESEGRVVNVWVN
jgi:hypothetical protein